MSDKETAPRCPKCSQPLKRVRYPSDSMLNRDQWDSIRAGDWFCECHNNHVGNQPYAYFWEKDLRVAVECTAPAPQPLISALKELRRWDCFVNREILPPGMSPRENGKWVKWADIEKLLAANPTGHAHARSRIMAEELSAAHFRRRGCMVAV